MGFISCIYKTANYKCFDLHHFQVEIERNNGFISKINVSNDIFEKELFEKLCSFLIGKDIVNREILKIDDFFYIIVDEFAKDREDRFYIGRLLKKEMEKVAEKKIYELQELKAQIRESINKFS